MVKFSEIINNSAEWTALVLLRPFNLKKFLIMGFAAYMAGYVVSGCNLNLGNSGGGQEKKAEISRSSGTQGARSGAQAAKQQARPDSVKMWNDLRQAMQVPWVIALVIAAVLILILIFILFMWLSSRFSFVFLENVVKNYASIKIPFRSYKEYGNSFFLFAVAMTAAFLLSLAAIISLCVFSLHKAGVFVHPSGIGVLKIFLICLPFVFVLVFLFLILAVINLIVTDFTLPVMFKDKVMVREAFGKSLAMISRNKGDVVIYALLKIGLSICAVIIFGFLSFALFFGILVPAIAAGAAFYWAYSALPVIIKPFFLVLGIALLVILVLFLSILGMMLNLPFAVFFRTLSLKFIACLDPHYDFFRFDSGQKEAVL